MSMPGQKSVLKAIHGDQLMNYGMVILRIMGDLYNYIVYKQLSVYDGQNAGPMETGLQLLL